MPNTSQIADLLYKKLLGIGTAQSGRKFYEETILGRAFVVPNQIWKNGALIPATAPPFTSGVVQQITGYPLVQVVGATNSFTGAMFNDIIPFNYGDGTSYNYALYDSTLAPISFGTNDWTVDTEAGILMFNAGIPSNVPPYISFYKYSGEKGFPNTGSFALSGQNLGIGSGIYSGTGINSLMFKTLSGGSGIRITGNPSDNTLVITVTGIVGGAGGGVSSLNVSGASVNGAVTLTGINGINVIISGQTINFGLSGSTGSFITTSQTGFFVDEGQTGVYADSGNLYTTGNTLALWTGISPTLFAPIFHTHNYLTGLSITGSAGISGLLTLTGFANINVIRSGATVLFGLSGTTGNFVTTSQTGIFIDAGETGSFVDTGRTGNFVDRGQTGGFVDAGKTGTLYPFSNPNSYATSGNLASTGSTLAVWTGITTGIFAPITHTHNYVTGLSITGSAGISGLLTLTGINSINVIQSGGFVLFGLSGSTGSFITAAQTGLLVDRGQTGLFVDRGQTGNYVDRGQTGNYVDRGQTGNFIDIGKTGTFYPASNPNSYATSGNLSSQSAIFSAWTGITPILYYPSGSNPSGYITGIGNGLILKVDSIYGNDSTAQRGVLNRPYLTPSGALASAIAGDTILLGPGIFNLGTGQLLLTPYVNLIGQGIDITIVQGARSGMIPGAILNPGSGCILSDFTIRSTGTGYIQFPLGAGSGVGQTFTNVILQNIKTAGDTDGFYVGRNRLCSFDAYNCEFTSNYDALSIFSGTGNFHNCNFIATGHSIYDASFARAIILNGPGVFNFDGGKILATGGTTTVDGISSQHSGTIFNLRNLSILSSMDGIHISNKGSVYLDNCSIQTARDQLDFHNGADDTQTGIISVANTFYNPNKVFVGDFGSGTLAKIIDRTPVNDIVRNWTGITIGLFYPLGSNPSGYSTGSNIIYNINSGSGIFIYRSGIASGVSQQFIGYPTTLDTKPLVIATLHNDVSPVILACQVSGVVSTGFYAVLSAPTNNTGYYLDIFASNSSQTGMATNVIIIGGSGTTTTASNIGNGSGIVSGLLDSDLKFKSLKTGLNIYITGSANELEIGLKNNIVVNSFSIPTNLSSPTTYCGEGIFYLYDGPGNTKVLDWQADDHFTIQNNNTPASSVINVYGSASSYISGFDIYSSSIQVNGSNVITQTLTDSLYLRLTGGYLTGLLSVGPSAIVSGANNKSILSITGVWSGSGAGSNWTSFTGLSITINNTGSGTYLGTNVYVNITQDDVKKFSIDSLNGTYIPNGVFGSFSFGTSPGTVTAFEMPVTGTSAISGIEQSYSFNANGTQVAKVYCEYDNSSNIQNESFVINSALTLKPSGLATNFVLNTKPFYFFSGASASTLTLPLINKTTGRHYIIKNRGAAITLTGIASDLIFSTSPVKSFIINSGDAINIINCGYFWNII